MKNVASNVNVSSTSIHNATLRVNNSNNQPLFIQVEKIYYLSIPSLISINNKR